MTTQGLQWHRSQCIAQRHKAVDGNTGKIMWPERHHGTVLIIQWRGRVRSSFVQILKKIMQRNGAPSTPTPHVKLSYIDILLWTINVRFLHHGRPPSSSLKRRNVTKSLAVFPFQKWPVTLHPCQSLKHGVVLRRSTSLFSPSNSSLLYSGGKNKVF